MGTLGETQEKLAEAMDECSEENGGCDYCTHAAECSAMFDRAMSKGDIGPFQAVYAICLGMSGFKGGRKRTQKKVRGSCFRSFPLASGATPGSWVGIRPGPLTYAQPA